MEGKGRDYLYYIPLVIIGSVNLWFGVSMRMGVWESIVFLLSMAAAGALEEILFRGFLFKGLCRGLEKGAVLITSLIFAFGHLVNLVNGSGAELVSNLLQVFYAFAIGYMFVLLFQKTGSIIPQIICHASVNGFNTFLNEELAGKYEIHVSVVLFIVAGLYALYLKGKKSR